MWLIQLGKVASVIYFVVTILFAYAHGIIPAAHPIDQSRPGPLVYWPLIPLSWLIVWAAYLLQKRLFEDMNFDRRDWIFYRSITFGSWGLYLLTWFLISTWVQIK